MFKTETSKPLSARQRKGFIKAVTIVFLMLFFISCDVLNVEPYHSIPAELAIETKKDVESAITGVYSSLQSAGYYGRNYLVAGDLAADNLNWTGTTAGYNQMDNNSILADNVIVEGIWSALYSTINRVNYTLEAIPGVLQNDENMTLEHARDFEAELRLIRAMAHFDLARMFGPVPVRIAVATISEEDLNVPRRPLNEVYAQIFEDLLFAETHLRDQIVRGKLSKAAAKALTARANLYKYSTNPDPGFLTAAVDYATMLIEDQRLTLEPEFATLFEGTPNSESIFEVNFGEQDRNRLAEYFFPTALSGRREFSPTEKLYDAFEETDVRRDVSIALDGNNLYAIKYYDIETGTDNVYVLRLAEMYLIRAEALVLLNTSLETARDDINAIRERAGLEALTTTDPVLLEEQVMLMRQLEFAFEGHRWFDLTRTGRAIDVLDGVTDECQYLFPIPLGELLTNFHEGMYQNDCY